MEDLSKESINDHFSQLYINISRKLEYSLFSYFQKLGLVPPQIKDVIDIREQLRSRAKSKLEDQKKQETGKNELSSNQENKIKKKMESYTNQFGAIIFTNEMNTSSHCPYCEKSWNDKINIKRLKFIEHRYVCGEHTNSHCEFDTKRIENDYVFLKDINDPDKVAAYNVSKKIKDYKDIRKLE